MDADEAKTYGFTLTKVVSLTDLVDELKCKDSQACESKQSLDDWVKAPVGQEEKPGLEELTDEKNEHKACNVANASLNLATASFAVNFLKARQAKLAKKKYEETDAYKNNDVLPSSIAVDIYLESLKTLKSQKEHRKVDLFKELREKKSTKRRDISFQKTISRLKHKDEDHAEEEEDKEKNLLKHRLNSPSHQHKDKHKHNSRINRTGALFEKNCMSPGPDAADQQRGLSKSGASKQRLTPAPSPAPFSVDHPIRRSRPFTIATAEQQEQEQEGFFVSEEEYNYNHKMESTLSEMMAEHNQNRGAGGGSEEHVAHEPFGTPLISRPLCRIYSSNANSRY